MKILLKILIVLFGTSSNVFGQTKVNDTTFIYKDTIEGIVQSIFIDPDPNSKYYEYISDFKLKDYREQDYNASLEYLKEKKIKLNKAKPIIPWTEWVEVLQYKGQFYVYKPCDFMYYFAQTINDSTFLDWIVEGPVANKIVQQKKIDDKTFEFTLTGPYSTKRKTIIHIVDNNKGIAVFEEIVSGRPDRYILMIRAEKVKTLPIIVNDCTMGKQGELDSEKPDFDALLKKKY